MAMEKILSFKEKILVFLYQHSATIDEILETIFFPNKVLWREIRGSGEYYRMRRRIFSQIYRLNKQGLIRTHKKGRNVIVDTTVKGEDAVNWLKKIKSPGGKWNGKWYVVIFDIPENFKRARFNLRRKLYELGFGLLQKSVFISPYNLLKEIEEITEYNQIRRYLRFLSVDGIDQEKELVLNSWDWKAINKHYADFIIECQNFVRRDFKGLIEQRIAVKELEKSFAQILKIDPCIPQRFLPNDWVGRKAKQLFTKITTIGYKNV